MKNCEFCKEIEGIKTGSFHQIYGKSAGSRIIYQDDLFFVVPTLGQLFKHSLLILPKNHLESLSELKNDELRNLQSVFTKVKESLKKYGSVVGFEHGAKSCTKGGCGIYHAHLHLIPLPYEISMFDFFKHRHILSSSLTSGLSQLVDAKEYLLAINPDNTCGTLNLSNFSEEYPSQYFRRKLSEHFSLESSWDWRKYNSPEPWLVDSLNELVV